MSSNIPMAPQGNVVAIGIPDSQDYPRLVYTAPYFLEVPLAELIEPSVIEAVENQLPSLVPPYVDAAAQAAVQQLAVLLTGSTMSGPLFLSPLMPTQPSQAATMAYVDSMIATAGIPEVPPVPAGQVWARETSQWVPITPQTGVFLPLSGGSMTGNINMSGNTIQNMAAVPAMPNGAAPAQWVLNQIASVSLYQGTWNADTNVPDLTQLSTHVNAYTWIALTTAPGGVVIGPAIPGLQGMTVYNGDTIIYSTVQGAFQAIHAGGITLPEADGRYVQLGGSQMSGALLLNANASQPLQAVTYQQLEAFVPPGAVNEAPNDGQLYGRNGLTHAWSPVLPLAGGILTGALTLSGNATANLNPVPLQQMTSAITAATAGYLPLAGAAMTGLMTLSGNASVGLNPVPLQQLTGMLGSYLPLSGNATVTGPVTFAAPNTGFTTPMLAVNNAGAGTFAVGPVWFTGSAGTLGIQGVSAGASAPLTTITLNATSTNATNLSASGNIGASNSISASNTIEAGTTVSSYNGRVVMGDYGVNYQAWTNAEVSFQWVPGIPGFNVYIGASFVGPLNLDTSDPRLKTNVGPVAKDALSVISQVPLQQFDLGLNPALDDPTTKHYDIGFMADTLGALIPEAVIPGNGTTTYDSLSLMPLVAYAFAAIQQLSARVSALDGKTA